MIQRPSFVVLGMLLLATVACPLSLPLAPLLGYPALVVIAVRLTLEWLEGRLERPAQAASTWGVYLGLVLILHGVLIGFDTALAGAPRTPARSDSARGWRTRARPRPASPRSRPTCSNRAIDP